MQHDASAAKAPRVEDEAADASLAELPPEMLNKIAGRLHDPLLTHYMGHLALSCRVIKEALTDSLAALHTEHQAARALVSKCGSTVEDIVRVRPKVLDWWNKHLTAADAPALISVLKSEALVRVEMLNLDVNPQLGAEGFAVIAAAAGGGLPRLKQLVLGRNQIGDSGVQALATAFADGAFRELEALWLGDNLIGDAGLTALAGALEKKALPALKQLHLYMNKISDDGVKALMAAAAGGGLPKLEQFVLLLNEYGEEGVEALAHAISTGELPSLEKLVVDEEHKENPRLVAVCEERGVELRS